MRQLRWRAAALFALLVSPFHQGNALARPIRVVAFGDSLSAGFMLPANASFPGRLEAALRAKGRDVDVINAGVSGDTATDGLARLDWSVPKGADLVIVQFGANDMLRGIDPAVTRRVLDEIITRLKARGSAVLLAGMRSVTNNGERYRAEFEAIYPALAEKYRVPLYPFFLEGIAQDPQFNLGDGIHPNQAGVAKIVADILPMVEAALDQLQAGQASSAAPANR